MTKKTPLILTVALLGLLSAGAMWFMQRGTVSPMLGGVYMGEVGMTEPSISMGILPGERDMYIEKTGPYPTSIAPMPPMYYDYQNDALDVTDRSIQKFASHSVIVDDVDGYMKSMRDYLQSVGGVVLSYNQGTSESDYIYGNISAKVPINRFDEAVNRITDNVKKVVSASVDAQDVTGQVVTIEKRVQALEDQKAVQEAALEEATTAAEEKKIQLMIDQLDKQIAQVKESQQVVEDRIDYATLNISAANREYYFTGNGPRPLSDVFREAWYSLRGTGFGLLYFLIWVVVYAIIWLPVLLLARWIWGKVRPAASKTTSK